jgi:hypothetical protein
MRETITLASRLRVTLSVSKVFEGDADIFIYDEKNLSTIDVKQEARNA